MKTSVRILKFVLRLVNLLCTVTLAVLLGITLAVFYSTQTLLPDRDGQRPWPEDTPIWIQDVLFALTSVATGVYILMFRRYLRGSHRRVERIAPWVTLLSFLVGLGVWGTGMGLIQSSRTWADGKDVWSWSCRSHPRFQQTVPYGLLCRFQVSMVGPFLRRPVADRGGQEWCLACCAINIVATCLSAILFALTAGRLRSKRKLREAMGRPDDPPSRFDPVPIPPPYPGGGAAMGNMSSAREIPCTSPRQAFREEETRRTDEPGGRGLVAGSETVPWKGRWGGAETEA